MWQELLMASRRQPAAEPGAGPEQPQQQHDGGPYKNSESSTKWGTSVDGKPTQVESAALTAVRSVLLTWKAEQQELQQPLQLCTHAATPTARPTLANSVSSNVRDVDQASTASQGDDIRAAAAVVSFDMPAQEHSGEHVLKKQQKQLSQEEQRQRTPQEQEQFLASLQQLLQLLQEHQKKQEEKQQQRQRSGMGGEEQQSSLPAEPPVLLPETAAAAMEGGTLPATEESWAPVAGVPAKSSSEASCVAGREVLQQLLGTCAPLSYPETCAYLQSVLQRQQQQRQQREQQLLLPQPLALAQVHLGASGEDGHLREPWPYGTSNTSWLRGAAAAAAHAAQQRGQQREDTRNSCPIVNPALLLLGSPSPRYFPKRPRGSAGSSWRYSGTRNVQDKDACCSSSNSATEEEQLYKEWLDHVHGVYIQRFDDTDEYRDDFDPGYRILDIPEAEYINDCNRMKRNPIELVGGRAACSRRPSPPPAPSIEAPFTPSRFQGLSSSYKSTSEAPPVGPFAGAAGTSTHSTSASGSGAALTAPADDRHYDITPSCGGRWPAAARTAITSWEAAAGPAGGARGSWLRSESRTGSPCFGGSEAVQAVAAGAAPPPLTAEPAEATGDAAEKEAGTTQDEPNSPSWGTRVEGNSDAVACRRPPAGCPVSKRGGCSKSVHTSGGSSFMQGSGSSLQRSSTEDAAKGEPHSRQNSMLTSGSTTASKNNSIPERERAGRECGRDAPTEEVANGEHNIKGSVSVEDELADCKVQLAPPSVSPYLPAGSPSSHVSPTGAPAAFPCDRRGASGSGAKQEQRDQQLRRRCEGQEMSSAFAAADVLLQKYTKEMRRAAAWRECYCDGDATLFRQKQEHSRYTIEGCSCSYDCCSRGAKPDPAERLPSAFTRGVADEVVLASTGIPDKVAGGGSPIWLGRASARDVAPLHADSGDAFYPVRVAGSQVLAFPRQQQVQHQRGKLWQEQQFWPQEGGKEGKKLLPSGCAAAAGVPSEQLLRQSHLSRHLQHPATADQGVSCCSKRGGNASNQSDALGWNAAADISAEARNSHGPNTKEDGNRGTSEVLNSVKHPETQDTMAATSNTSRLLGQMQQHDARRNCCSCSCGCSSCCLSKSSSNGSIPVGGRVNRSVVFDCFYLKVVFERGKTGFEDHRELILPPGTLFAGRYLVQQEVGRAAFSRCLRCIDTATKLPVCLKIIKNEKEYMDQSLDEVKTLRYLQANGDPDLFHYVQLLDCFYHREHLVLVTELLSHNLYHFSSSLKKVKLPSFWTLGRVQRIARELLLALHFVHKLHVIHCDLKPENVLLRPSFFSDLAYYKDLAGKHPLTIIKEAAQQAAAAAGAHPAAAGGAAVAGSRAGVAQAAVGMDGMPVTTAEPQAALPASAAAALGGRQRTGGITVAGGRTEKEAATGVGGGVRISGEHTGIHSLASAQLYRSAHSSSNSRESRRTQDSAAQQPAVAGGRAFLEAVADTNSSSRSESGVVQQCGEAEQQRLSHDSGALQEQQPDCYERPKKQQYLQQQSVAQQDIHAGQPCLQLQQQQVDELLMRQRRLEQPHDQQQVNATSPWRCAEKDNLSQFGPHLASGGVFTRESAAPTTAPKGVPSSTLLQRPACSVSLSSCATPASAADVRCSGLLQGLEQERTAMAGRERTRADGCTTQGSLRDFVAAAAAAATAENLSVKLIDFGNSCRTSDALIAYVQSRSYRAPEVLLELPYGSKIDIWSLGCVLFELFTGVVLFMNEGVHSLLARIVGIIGQLPWYMVNSSPKRHALFDADGYLYTVIQTSPPFPASAPPAVSAPGGGRLAGVGAADPAAGSALGGGASDDPEVDCAVGTAGRDGGIADSKEDTEPQRRCSGGAHTSSGGGGRLSHNSSTTYHSTGSCDNSRGCLRTMSGLKQQQQAEWVGSSRPQGPAGMTCEQDGSGVAAETGRGKRIYERASQDSNVCQDRPGSPSAAPAVARGGQTAPGEEARAAGGSTETGAPRFGRRGSPHGEWSGTAAGVTTATDGGVPAPHGPAKSTIKSVEEGGRTLRFLLPKPSSLRQRLRVDDNLFIDFLENMLKIDPVERWSAERLLRHPFLQRGLYADGL